MHSETGVVRIVGFHFIMVYPYSRVHVRRAANHLRHGFTLNDKDIRGNVRGGGRIALRVEMQGIRTKRQKGTIGNNVHEFFFEGGVTLIIA